MLHDALSNAVPNVQSASWQNTTRREMTAKTCSLKFNYFVKHTVPGSFIILNRNILLCKQHIEIIFNYSAKLFTMTKQFPDPA